MATSAIACPIHCPGFLGLGRAVIRPLLLLAALAVGLAPAAETWMALGRLGRAPASLHGIMAISAGAKTVVALRNDGTVVAWGRNDYGQAQVPAGLSGVVAVASGFQHTLALKEDGTVVAWGRNQSGECSVPDGLTGVVAIAANERLSMALKGDGTVVAWGLNSSGQATVPDGLTGVVAIAAGLSHAVALKGDGTVVTWGAGPSTVPVGLSGVVAVVAGTTYTVALKNDGTVVAWGAGFVVPVPSDLQGVRAISGCRDTILALKNDGTVVGWGVGSAMAAQAATLSGVTAVAAWDYNGAALRSDGSLVALGNMRSPSIDWSDAAQIVTGPSEEYSAARLTGGTVATWGDVSLNLAAVPGDLTTAMALAASRSSVAALTVDGTVTAWGLGATQTVPDGLSGVTALAAGTDQILALKNDGTVSAWGSNASGQIATSGLSGIRAIAAGNLFSLAARNDGTVTAFGDNTYGQTTVPAGLTGVQAVAAGNRHALALKSDGSVVGWGSNASNQATPPSGLANVVAIAAGTNHSLALKSDGAVVGWGRDDEGAITVPASVTGVTAIAAGGYASWLRLPSRPVNAVTLTSRTVRADGSGKPLTVATANGRRPTRVTYNGSDALPSAVGTYTVVAEADYLDSYGSATGALVITDGTQTISFPAAGTVVYGTPFALSATASSGLPVTYAVVSGPGVLNGSSLTATGLGTIQVRATQAGDAAYDAAQATQDVSVAKATLLVTATNQGRLVGAANPTLTATISGYVNGEDASVVTGGPVLSTTATAGSAAGVYPITVDVSGMSATNYDFVGVSGSLVVSTSTPGGGSGGGGGGGGCGIGSSLGLLLAPLLAALRFWRRRERVG